MERKHKSLWLYALAALIPCLLLLVNFALLESVPFGTNTILIHDANHQYPDFAVYLRSIFSGENDLFYTFSKNLGGEMVSLFCYYLFSPFSIIFALATAENIPYLFTLVIVLKICTCGITFFHAASRRFGCKWQHLIFSTAYALMAYNTLFGWNIMWMDGVIVLPLLALGLEGLWRGESPRLYICSLAYGLMTNFYIGYMLCIGSVLFSFALMIAQGAGIRKTCIRFGRFALASGIGGFIAAFSWLPTFFTLISGRGSAVSNVFVWTRTFNILGLAGKLVAGSADAEQLGLGLPQVFCGIFTVVLLAVFILNKKNSIKNRAIVLGIMAVLIISFLIRGLDVIWHGFSPNNAFNFRYSFILCYVMLVTAQYAWEQRETTPKLCFAVSGALVLLLCPLLFAMKYLLGVAYISPVGLLVSACVTVVLTLYLLLGWEKRRFAAASIALVCFFEMGANYYLSIYRSRDGVVIMDLSEYQDFVRQTEPVVDHVKQLDSGFYRMEKTYYRSQNDSLLLGYNGVSHFSSSQDKAVPRFMKALGMNDLEGIWAQYGKGSTATLDTLFGIKYMLSQDDLTSQRGYPLVQTVGEIGIYENPNVLPVAMFADGKLREASLAGENCFAMQNIMANAIAGDAMNPLLMEENWTCTMENLMPGDAPFTYVKEDPEQEAALTYTVEITRTMPLYFYIYAPDFQDVKLCINGRQDGVYFAKRRWDVVYAGTYDIGQQVQITLVPNEQTLMADTPVFCYEDLQTEADLAQKIRENPTTLNRESSSHLTGTVTADRDGMLLFTIPYDDAWKLTIDGAPAKYHRVLDIFMAAEVEPGEHSFALRYEPKGALTGCVISAGAAAAAIVWLIIEKRKKQMP